MQKQKGFSRIMGLIAAAMLGGGAYKLKARLKYRLNGGSVKFWYELDRPERAIEDAFAGYVATLRDKSGYQVLLGQP
jgi:hypothetical protein